MEKILIATDFSEASQNAMNYGASLARFFDAKLVLVYSFTLPIGGYGTTAPMSVISELQASGMTALLDEKAKIIRSLGRDPGIECVCEIGSVLEVLKETIASKGIELVVMGLTGGSGELERKVMGSNAIAAVRDLEVPVILVPEGIKYQPIKKIDFACDLDQVANTTLFYSARAVSALFGARLEIIYVSTPADEKTEVDFDEMTESMREVQVKKVILRNNDPAKAIQAYTATSKPDLLMINPKRHNLFHNLFGRSVTRALSVELKMPLLAIH